jgi:glycosyltransferase involved in cell wall biosynthesis
VTERVAMRRPFDLAAVRRTAALMRRYQVDLVHTHFLRENFIAIMAAKLAGVRGVVNTVHMLEPKSRKVAWLNRQMLRGSSRVIAVSEAVRQLLLAEGLPPEKLVRIYNGVEVNRYLGAVPCPIPERFGLTAQHLLVGTVGRLSPEKGQTDLLEAFARVHQEEPNARLVIAGDGPERGRLALLADSLGIEPFVHWLGFWTDVPGLLAALDLVAIPSRSEALGLAVLEAQAAACPVVATAVGGIPEILCDREAGLLVPPASAQPLADAILTLLRDPERRRQMGAAGRRHVKERFDLAVMVRQTLGVYAEAMGETV